MRQMFNPMLFVIHNGVLCYNRHTDSTKPYNALRICVPEVIVKEVFSICHEGVSAGQGRDRHTGQIPENVFYHVSM